MRLLDLFCCAGGAAMGYYRAGFTDITGIDIKPQPRYPFNFIQADALEYLAAHGHEYDVIHASPPCQAYSVTKSLHNNDYPMLVEDVRKLLQAIGKPYIIENVPGAPLNAPLKLNGHHFGLKVIRERWFETNPWLMSPGFIKPKHVNTCSRRSFSSFENGATHISVAGHNFKVDDGKAAMQIDWMIGEELAEAIPPAYTQWIGERLLEMVMV